MEGVRDLPGAGAGTFRDGGLLDYHLDLPYSGDGIVLYPHFTDRVIPGWFDKTLPWRRASVERLQDVLLLAPSKEYLARLPYGKLPDRNDFKRFMGDAPSRQKYWHAAMDESRRLGDEFLELAANGSLAERLLTFSQPANTTDKLPACRSLRRTPSTELKTPWKSSRNLHSNPPTACRTSRTATSAGVCMATRSKWRFTSAVTSIRTPAGSAISPRSRRFSSRCTSVWITTT